MAIVDKKGVMHGSISNIVYRNWRDINVVQMKPHKVKQTRSSKEAALEFGLCSSTAKIIRAAFEWTYMGYDGEMINRCTSVVRKCISASFKARGERDIHDADISFLKGFRFNANSPLDKALRINASAELNSDNKVVIDIPALTYKDFKGPLKNVDQYIVRFMVVAFDFRRKVYSYVATKEIKVTDLKGFKGESVVFDETLPEGRLVAVSMSIHAYNQSFNREMENLNSTQWSPSEIINIWQLPLPETEEAEERAQSVTKAYINTFFESIYAGSTMLTKVAALRLGKVKKQKVPQIKAERRRPLGTDLPKGDVKF